LAKRDEKRNIYRKIYFDEKGIIIGAILINQVDDLGVIQGLVRERKGGEDLKSISIWNSPMSCGIVYKNMLQGRL
jgi:NAD(P)H-nitrite reductase large subunit